MRLILATILFLITTMAPPAIAQTRDNRKASNRSNQKLLKTFQQQLEGH